MAGGLMQLVAYGAQDVYLTGNPQITFFKVVYRRHTNFAVECMEQICTGTINVSSGGRQSVTITRNGDLVTNMYLMIKFTSDNSVVLNHNAGNHLVKSVDLQIGGTSIDKHYGDWMAVWADLTIPHGKQPAYRNMVNKNDNDTCNGVASAALATGDYTLYVPLQFFCNKIGRAHV